MISSIKRRLRSAIREGAVYRIPFGPARGLRLQAHAQISVREILGLWERHNFSSVRALCDAGLIGTAANDVMFDIGANFGLYSLFFAKLLRGRGRVIAFEPADVPRRLLELNVEANGFTNVTIEPLACSNVVTQLALYLGNNHHNSSLRLERIETDSNTRTTIVQVSATTLDHYWSREAQPSEKLTLVKIDIEGAADTALPYCVATATTQRNFFLVESHSTDEDRAIADFARNCDYALFRTTNRRWVENASAVHPDPAGVWGTLLLIPREQAAAARRVLGPD